MVLYIHTSAEVPRRGMRGGQEKIPKNTAAAILAKAENKEEIRLSNKYVYLFSEGNGSMRELLGGKGANLAEMTLLGLPVPQGFTVTTEACTRYYDDGRAIGEDILEELYPDGIDETTINDLFWFDRDVIASWLGYEDD